MGNLKGATIDLSGLFALDAILPSQFYDRSLSRDDGIYRLLGAILEDAVRTFQSVHPTKPLSRGRQRLVREAEVWLFDSSAHNPLSYHTVCESLGIDPDAFREGLLKWRRRYLAEGTLKKLPRRVGVQVEGRIRS